MYIVIGVACSFIPEADALEPKFNKWQVMMKPDGYPKLRYIDLDSQTSIGFTYTNSTDCSDIKLEVRRFMEQDVVIPVGTMYAGQIFVNNRRFDFPAQAPEVAIAATLQVVQAVWGLGYPFYSELIKADRLFWRDNTMPVDQRLEIGLAGFIPMINITMEMCHLKYIEDNPQNKIRISKPMYSVVNY
jgi:hypothetical protein